MPTNKQPASEPDPSHTFSLATMLLRPRWLPSSWLRHAYLSPGSRRLKLTRQRGGPSWAAGIGLFVGVTIALRRRRWGFGLALAVLVGIPAGAATAVLLAEPHNLSVVLVGSAVLVLFGVVVRKLSHIPVE